MYQHDGAMRNFCTAVTLLAVAGCATKDRATVGKVGAKISDGIAVATKLEAPSESESGRSHSAWSTMIDLDIPLSTSSITQLGSYTLRAPLSENKTEEQASYYLIKNSGSYDPECPNGYVIVVMGHDDSIKSYLDNAAKYSMNPDNSWVSFSNGYEKSVAYQNENVLSLNLWAKTVKSPDKIDLTYEGIGDNRKIKGSNKFNFTQAGNEYIEVAKYGSPYDVSLSKFFSQDGESYAVLLRVERAEFSQSYQEVK